MVFYCQRNCYDSQYSTVVVSCKPSKTEDIVNGKKTKITCYEVTFADTVFFPEGGGQPYDKGHINNTIPVLKVLRRGGDAIHYLTEPLEVGSSVTQHIDWSRRHDHMQQHSAQHLITAIADRDYQCPTLSWNLGEKVSIELGVAQLSDEQLSDIEDKTNEAIRNHLPVSIQEFDAKDPKLLEVRTRGLPDDVVGPVRVVTIESIESNMCCGTHVRNLADLQSIKILNAEKGKAGKTLLYFVAGKRVLRYLGECVSRERELSAMLHTNPSDIVRLVEKSKKDLKQSLKSLNDAFRDLAVAEAFKFNQISSPRPKLLFHHRRDGDSDYLGAIISELNDETVLKVLTAGEDAGPGILVIHGNQEDVNAISRGVCDILEGKGGGKTRFTAKIKKPSKRKEAEKYVREMLPHLNS